MYLRLFAHILVAGLISALYYDIGNDGAKVLSNLGFLFFNMLFLMYTSMTITILSCKSPMIFFLRLLYLSLRDREEQLSRIRHPYKPLISFLFAVPLELPVLLKENFNRWYSLKSYYLAITVSDLPFQVRSKSSNNDRNEIYIIAERINNYYSPLFSRPYFVYCTSPSCISWRANQRISRGSSCSWVLVYWFLLLRNQWVSWLARQWTCKTACSWRRWCRCLFFSSQGSSSASMRYRFIYDGSRISVTSDTVSREPLWPFMVTAGRNWSVSR